MTRTRTRTVGKGKKKRKIGSETKDYNKYTRLNNKYAIFVIHAGKRGRRIYNY